MRNTEMSLRSLSPKLYYYITEKLLESFHIHSYDIQINAAKKESGIHIIVKFGENFAHTKEQYFTYDSLEKNKKQLNEFIQKTGESCKKMLMNDYFKMMTP